MASTPAFIGTPNCGTPTTLTAASINPDGTGSTLVFTAGVNGAYVDRVVAVPRGTNAATVLRVFKNNGGPIGTPGNNFLVREVTCPLSSVSQTAAQAVILVPLQFTLDAGWQITVAIGTALAAGLDVSVENSGNF